MELLIRHPWKVTPGEAVSIQDEIAGKVLREDSLPDVRYVAGVDVGFENRGKTTRSAIAVLSYPALELYEYAIARCETEFPYVPGLLSFREIPAVLQAMDEIRQLPDLILCDGQGYAHPRRFGIACHLGVITGLPTIGVAKTRLTGTSEKVPEPKGRWTALRDRDEIIGAVLRTRAGVKPLYISIGHRITLETALDYVMTCTTKYRLPETTRWAHRLASGPPLK